MNPVEIVNHRLRHPDINYELRPSSYWEPASDVLQTVLRNVTGTRRREMITDFFRQDRPDELTEELSSDELSDEARKRLGRIHPSFMGGEHLPGYRASEVEVVRIELESTTAHVISVRARRSEQDSDSVCSRVDFIAGLVAKPDHGVPAR